MNVAPDIRADPKLEADELWFKDAIIYQLHVKAFADSNHDGIGDFAGLTEKLDYLQDLGVTALWLLPFYPSPGRDDGYDISDYRHINPDFGTLQDFRRFMQEARRRKLRVIIELVINHTSDRHPWFERARRSKPTSDARNWYVWSDSEQKYAGTRIIFNDAEKSNWAWDPEAQAYYWHRFFSHQPDLNFDNPRVLMAIMRVMRHWLDLGIDGFRLGAIPYLCEREGTSNENLPETHAVIKNIRAALDSYAPGKVLLAEANQWPEDVAAYFGAGDECHMAYHFGVMPRICMAIAQADRFPITDILRQTPDIPVNCQWAMFLRNHDELTLEMVTDIERDYLWSTYATDPRARLNLGIRRRLASLMDNERPKIELMNSLLMSFPGTPIIYYGDEIGMGDNIYLGDRNGVRTPMQWTPDRNGGFSRCDPAELEQASDIGAQIQQDLRQGLAQPHPAGEPLRVRLRAAVPKRRTTLRCQPVALGTSRRDRPLALARTHSLRNARTDELPADRRERLRGHTRSLRLLLVPAPRAGGIGDRNPDHPRGIRDAGRHPRVAVAVARAFEIGARARCAPCLSG